MLQFFSRCLCIANLILFCAFDFAFLVVVSLTLWAGMYALTRGSQLFDVLAQYFEQSLISHYNTDPTQLQIWTVAFYIESSTLAYELDEESTQNDGMM